MVLGLRHVAALAAPPGSRALIGAAGLQRKSSRAFCAVCAHPPDCQGGSQRREHTGPTAAADPVWRRSTPRAGLRHVPGGGAVVNCGASAGLFMTCQGIITEVRSAECGRLTEGQQ